MMGNRRQRERGQCTNINSFFFFFSFLSRKRTYRRNDDTPSFARYTEQISFLFPVKYTNGITYLRGQKKDIDHYRTTFSQ